jgi:hypothetical protein
VESIARKTWACLFAVWHWQRCGVSFPSQNSAAHGTLVNRQVNFIQGETSQNADILSAS